MGPQERGLERTEEELPRIETERLVLRLPGVGEARRALAFHVANEEHLGRWERPRPEGFLTLDYWRRQLSLNRRELREDRSLRLFLFLREPTPEIPSDDEGGPAVGVCNFSNFVRGRFQACHLGYSLDRRLEGAGYMSEALRVALEHAFGPLRMHRVMANHLPENERSARVLARLGFVEEGYAEDYLWIDGDWRDHVLTALTSPDPRSPEL